MQDVSLRQLRAFEATMRLGRISAAAAELHVTAPAVGQQLKLLRQAIGVEVSIKTQDGFTPTNAGLELLGAIHRIETELTRCRSALSAISAGSAGTVDVAAVSTTKYFVPYLLARFRETHPDIQVRLTVGNRRATVELLANHGADMVVMGRPPRELDLITSNIGPNPHVVVASPDHPLTRRRSVPLTDLLDEPFLVREAGSGTRNLADAMFRDRSLTPPSATIMASNETIKQAAIAGLGIGLLSSYTVQMEVEAGRLKVIPVRGLPIIRHWFTARPEGIRLLPAAQAFWDFLVQDAAQHLPKLSAQSR